jgi:hypothetical protein
VALGAEVDPDLLDDLARVGLQHVDAVAHRDRLLDVVCDEDDGLPRGLDRVHELALELDLERVVEGLVGLVHQDDVRIGDHRPHERGPLAHAARELVREDVLAAGEVVALEQRGGPSAGLPARDTVHLQPEDDVLQDRPPRHQQVLLQDVADRPVRVARGVGPVDQDPAFRGGEQTGDDVEQRGLAAAGRSDEGDELAGLRVEVDAVQDERAVAVALPDAVDLDRVGHGHSVPAP